VTAQDQSTAYKQNTLRVNEIESDSDHTMKVCQDIQEQINRCVKQDPSTATAVPSSDALIAAAAAIVSNGIYGAVDIIFPVIPEAEALTVADGLRHFRIPASLAGFNLTGAVADVQSASTSGLPSFQINNTNHSGGARDMLSTNITIDENKTDSKDATTPVVIDPTKRDVEEANILRFDCDVAGTGTEGWNITLTFTPPT
jgi:hypothetical protein